MSWGKVMKIFNEVKQFYLSNKGISKIGIVSTLISISYILTYEMPDYFGIEPLYVWINNIAISYIAAMIFFVVQVYIPEQSNKKQCMEVLKNKFSDLAKFIDITILVYKKHVKIKEKGADLLWNSEEEKIYVKYSKIGDTRAFSYRSYTKSEILNLEKVYNKKIANIKDSSVIKFCDYELLEVLTRIEAIKFFETIQYVVMLADTETNLQSCSDVLNELQELNDKMKKICKIDTEYQLYEIEEMDKIYANLPRNNIVKNLKSVKALNIEIEKQNIKRQVNTQGDLLPDEVINVMAQMAVEAKLKKNNNKDNLPRND